MKFAFLIFVALTLFACSHGSTPTAPSRPVTTASSVPTAAALTSLWGFVVEPSGVCIKDAMVEVVRGQAQGQRIMQDTPCGAWDYGGGFVFKELAPGVEMTLRASAPGWSTEDKTFVPHPGVQIAVLISLKKL
jgi:hypothetical protein